MELFCCDLSFIGSCDSQVENNQAAVTPIMLMLFYRLNCLSHANYNVVLSVVHIVFSNVLICGISCV